jgi:eukaryotic-like serine/threonine-protein kinase
MDNVSPEKLSPRLRGDLDNIVLMALRKEPQRRYGSVEQFATDIQRHLAHLPVSASRDTFWYRTSKFVRRHKAGAVAAIAIAVTLVLGLAATLYEARIARAQELRAEKRFNDVRKLAHSLMFEIHDSIRDLPGSTSARKLLVDRALEYLDSLSAEGGSDPSLSRELAFAYERVGDVQGYFYSANLGDTAGAMKSYQKALAIREALARNNPKDRTAQSDLAASYNKVADALYSTGDQAGALEKTRQVLTIRQALAAADPTSENARWDLGDIHRALGDALIDIPDWAAATEEYKAALAGFEELSAAHPDSMRYRRMVAIAHDKIGYVDEHAGDVASARREYQQAVQILQQLVMANPTNTLLQRNLAISYLDTGDVAVANGDARGIRDLMEAAKIVESISAKDPANRQIDRDISLIYSRLGDAEKKNGNTTLALQYYSRGLAAAKRRAAADPQNVDAAESVANRYQSIGNLYAAMAVKQDRTGAAPRQLWENARSSFQKSLSFWLDPHRSSKLSGPDTRTVEELQRSLRECDTALKKAVAQNSGQ